MSERIQRGHVIEIDGYLGNWIVEKARLAGGGTGHGPHDVYPDGWEVTARALGPNYKYQPDGQVVTFMQKGEAGSHCYSTQRSAKIVADMVIAGIFKPIPKVVPPPHPCVWSDADDPDFRYLYLNGIQIGSVIGKDRVHWALHTRHGVDLGKPDRGYADTVNEGIAKVNELAALWLHQTFPDY